METGLHFLMQKTKSKISKTFVYQFESNFHIESSADNITLDFSDNKYISKSTDFIGDLKIESVEIVHLNSRPSLVPSLYFDDNIKSKYLITNTLSSNNILTDSSNDKKLKIVYSINEKLNEFSGTKQYFTNPDGSPLLSGKLLVQKDLSNVLKAISSQGSSVFYSGWIAEKMIEDNTKNGGVLSMEALASYEAKTSHIVSGNYRGYDLNALWMPAFGAITIEALHILELLESDLSNKFEWAESVHDAIDAAYLDRRVQFTLDDAKRFTSKAWAKKRVDDIKNANLSSLTDLPDSYTALLGHTTHLTVADKNGMVVALTQTIGTTMGSKVATPGLGFMYAQTLGGYLGEIKPGVRAPSHISPIIVSREGKPFLALGAAGGSRIPSSIVAVISRVIDQNFSLADAMALPRVHPTSDNMEIEAVSTNASTYNEDYVYSLKDTLFFNQLGHSMKLREGKANFGRVYAIMREGNDWVAVSDPDWQGSSGAVK